MSVLATSGVVRVHSFGVLVGALFECSWFHQLKQEFQCAARQSAADHGPLHNRPNGPRDKAVLLQMWGGFWTRAIEVWMSRPVTSRRAMPCRVVCN